MKKTIYLILSTMLILCIGFILYMQSDLYIRQALASKNWQLHIDLALSNSNQASYNPVNLKYLTLRGKIQFLSNGTYLRVYNLKSVSNNSSQSKNSFPLTDKGTWDVRDRYLFMQSSGFKIDSSEQSGGVKQVLKILGDNSEQILKVQSVERNTAFLLGLDTPSIILEAN